MSVVAVMLLTFPSGGEIGMSPPGDSKRWKMRLFVPYITYLSALQYFYFLQRNSNWVHYQTESVEHWIYFGTLADFFKKYNFQPKKSTPVCMNSYSYLKFPLQFPKNPKPIVHFVQLKKKWVFVVHSYSIVMVCKWINSEIEKGLKNLDRN